MPFAEHFMVQGVTTSAQTATLPASISINCGFVPTKIEIFNETRWGANATGFRLIQKIDWNYLLPLSSKVQNWNAAGTGLLNTNVVTNGISVYDSSASVLLGPVIAGTVITRANPAVCTTAAHGLQTGDQIIMTNNTVMTQLGGLRFTVTVTDATHFTIPIDTTQGGLNSSNETSFVIRKVIVPELYYPAHLSISSISQATSAVISTTTNHGLTVGQQIRIRVPVGQGMTQMNNLQGLILTVPSATTFTVNINSSAFTAFTWPAAVNVGGAFSQAAVIPVGSGPSQVTTPPFWYEDKLSDATTNIGFQGFIIGTGLLQTAAAGSGAEGLVAGDVLSWTAWRADV